MKNSRTQWLYLVAIACHAHAASQTNALPEWTASGVVYAPEGTTVPGANLRVWRSADPFQNFMAGADGIYTVHWQTQRQPPTSRVPKIKSALVVRDVARNLVATRDLDETNAIVDVQLQPGITIAGSVQDANGRPMPGADVSLHMWINKAGAELTRTQSETNGTFSFTALPPAGDFAVEVTTRGNSRERIQLSATRAQSNRIELPPMQLRPASFQIAGTVVGLDNQPLAGVMVSLTGSGQPGGSVRTDDRGHFVFNEVVEGPVRGFASLATTNWSHPTMTGRFQTQSGDTNVFVILQPVQPQ